MPTNNHENPQQTWWRLLLLKKYVPYNPGTSPDDKNGLQAGTGPGTPTSRATTPIPPSEVPIESIVADDSLLSRSATAIYDIMLLKRKVFEFWLAVISVILPDEAEADDSTLPSGIYMSRTCPKHMNEPCPYRCTETSYRGDNRPHSISIISHNCHTHSSQL